MEPRHFARSPVKPVPEPITPSSRASPGGLVTPERWRRIKEVFQAALDLPPEERDAYLAVVTPGDGELRREVDRMLQHATGTGMLDTPAWNGLQIDNEFEAGSRLGPYEIVEQVGAGGMGKVYKARDTRLGRIVAIKVLSAEFSHRLRIEGRAISALNHPHVCALYDIGNQDGAAFLVMEFVEGQSLTARLATGPLPFDDVLRYGAEIASALAAAHTQGIVHRDLKPANIMITASGAKVLDFGVAQIAEDEETPAGAVVGTAAYMSPSQLNGNPADARSDIYALGLVLYEMAAGTRYSPQSPKLPPGVPADLANLIERCLRENAASRVQRMDEVRIALDGLRSVQAAASHRSPRRTKIIRIAAVVAIFLAARVGTWHAARNADPWMAWTPARSAVPPKMDPPKIAPPKMAPPAMMDAGRMNEAPGPAAHPSPSRAAARPAAVSPVRFAPPKPFRTPSLSMLASYPGFERDPSFSPDGANIAFSWNNRARSGYGIYVRPVIGGPPVNLTDSGANDWGSAWSPDGSKIAFERRASESGIYWLDAAGGPANLVAPIARPGQETLPQLSWSRDGKWIAAPDRDAAGATQIYFFAIDSGERRALTSDAAGTNHAPAFSPDGKSLAYSSCRGAVFPCDVYVVDLDRSLAPKRRRRITEENIYVRGLTWLPDGRSLVYSAGQSVSTDTSLWRVSVNPPGLPERIDIAGSQARHPAISKAGSLAFTRLGDWKLMMIRNFR